MGTFSGNIISRVGLEALERIQSALIQLRDMSVVVELDRARTDFEPSLSRALGSEGPRKRQQKSKGTDTLRVNKVPSHGEPWGHATISIDEDTAVGLEPDSNLAAATGLAEDLAAPMGLDSGAAVLPHYVSGHIQQDYRIPEKHAVIHVTARQAAEARAFIRQAETNPQIYDFLYQNCAEWVEDVLGAAAINVPADVTPGGLVEYLKNRYPQ
jgi:hypothetical protein